MGEYVKTIDGATVVTPRGKKKQKDDQLNKKRIKQSELEIENLVPFASHPFKLYTGQRFTDMVESIRANGVLHPIIVRRVADGKFEILSGHNRVEAAKEAGLELIPGVIHGGLTDEEAMLIVTETNLIQRSFADLRHSEKAVVLATHYGAMKKNPGYRSDLLDEVEELTRSPVGARLKTADKLGAHYGLSKNTVARYLRINALVPALKERLDNDGIGMRVSEALSYLRPEEQDIVESLLAAGKKISIKQAEELKKESENEELNKAYIERIFESGYYPAKVKPVKLSGQFLSQHFRPSQSAEEVEGIIAEALEAYFSKRNG